MFIHLIARINRCFFEIVVNLSLLQPIFARMNWHRPWWISDFLEVVQPFGRTIWCYICMLVESMGVFQKWEDSTWIDWCFCWTQVYLVDLFVCGSFIWLIYEKSLCSLIRNLTTCRFWEESRKQGNPKKERHVPFQTSNWFFGNWRSSGKWI